MFRKIGFIHFLLSIALISFLGGRAFFRPIDVQPDSHRYIAMGLNVADHGLKQADPDKGESWPTPAYGDAGPFIALELGLTAMFSPETYEALQCYAKNPTNIQFCNTSPMALKAVYTIETAIFHFSILGIGLLVFGCPLRAWLLVALSFCFSQISEYATSVLTEPAYLMASGLFFVSLANIYRNHARRSAWIFLGLTLGLLIIIKPVWFVILPFAIPVLIFAQWQRWLTPKDASINGFIFIGCATLIFMPFIIRNGITMDVWRLANPTYLGQALAHRLAFNDMSWLEWAIGWLYYLPDFGDNLSADLFGKTAIAKLGWSPESYYVHGRDILYYQALEATPQGDASAWLLQNYFFNDVIKTTAVGLLLSWRGIFVGDMVGFVSVCLSIPALLIMPKQRLSICLLMLLPIAVVVGANGMASVSIPRYNLPLVILYTITIAQVLSWVAARTVPLLPTRLHGLMAIALPKNI